MVRVTSNANKLADTMRQHGRDVPRAYADADKKYAKDVVKKARQFTQTEFYTLAELRDMGHPYATRNPRPPMRPHVLSAHSRELHGSWAWNFGWTGDGWRVTVYNSAPHAKYMRGTKYMIARPVLEEAFKRTASLRKRRRQRSIGRGF